MTTKFKILSSIAFISLAIVLTFIGVWALTDLDFIVGGNITYTAPKPKIDLQQDANGFYVTMGTYNDDDVVWRLVGLDGEKFTGSTAPSAGSTGTFILETLIDYDALSKTFGSSNDYATSDIRAYLNDDYLTFLSLTDDATYQAIAERSVSDMYTDIGWNCDGYDSSYAENAVYSITTTNTESDKLWLMSVAEVYTLLGGGTITDSTISTTWSDDVKAGCNWDADNTSDYYWLRSPFPDYFGLAFVVTDVGDWSSGDVVFFPYAVRPAFNLNF